MNKPRPPARTPQMKAIQLHWNQHPRQVWVVDHFDSYLDEFAEDVGGQLTDEHCPFGVMLWPAARALANLLARSPGLGPERPRRIVELGCGVGFLSCVLASLYPEAEVWACDYEPVLEAYVEANARTWGLGERLRFQELDWRQELPAGWGGTFDWVVGADVFYDDSHIMHLPPCAAALLGPRGRLTLADPKRFRFSLALDRLSELFELENHLTEVCSLEQEGIEEVMINLKSRESLVSILDLRKKSATP